MTDSLKRELDMSDYDRFTINRDSSVTFHLYLGVGPTEHVFSNDKTLTANDLRDRQKAREKLGLPHSKLETKALQDLTVQHDSNPSISVGTFCNRKQQL